MQKTCWENEKEEKKKQTLEFNFMGTFDILVHDKVAVKLCIFNFYRSTWGERYREVRRHWSCYRCVCIYIYKKEEKAGEKKRAWNTVMPVIVFSRQKTVYVFFYWKGPVLEIIIMKRKLKMKKQVLYYLPINNSALELIFVKYLS